MTKSRSRNSRAAFLFWWVSNGIGSLVACKLDLGSRYGLACVGGKSGLTALQKHKIAIVISCLFLCLEEILLHLKKFGKQELPFLATTLVRGYQMIINYETIPLYHLHCHDD
ncbi:hypothetical protein PJIAN_1361 [Paludibacter jiangxiensis]|uniref:Uncharacterized protein n=1 Tax=Paludibacter jiangxiensis TaxID=681398 RepID=A0A161LD64_9BACT|nr:hypothetical protein PJIAN_1361 [Paludibacter jiangxiensis]